MLAPPSSSLGKKLFSSTFSSTSSLFSCSMTFSVVVASSISFSWSHTICCTCLSCSLGSSTVTSSHSSTSSTSPSLQFSSFTSWQSSMGMSLHTSTCSSSPVDPSLVSKEHWLTVFCTHSIFSETSQAGLVTFLQSFSSLTVQVGRNSVSQTTFSTLVSSTSSWTVITSSQQPAGNVWGARKSTGADEENGRAAAKRNPRSVTNIFSPFLLFFLTLVSQYLPSQLKLVSVSDCCRLVDWLPWIAH